MIGQWLTDADKSRLDAKVLKIVEDCGTVTCGESEINENAQEKTSCCQIFSLYKIKYDNAILNHPEVLRQLSNQLSQSQDSLTSLFEAFDQEFLAETLIAGDIQLLADSLI